MSHVATVGLSLILVGTEAHHQTHQQKQTTTTPPPPTTKQTPHKPHTPITLIQYYSSLGDNSHVPLWLIADLVGTEQQPAKHKTVTSGTYKVRVQFSGSPQSALINIGLSLILVGTTHHQHKTNTTQTQFSLAAITLNNIISSLDDNLTYRSHCGLSLILVGTETAASQAQNSEHLARTSHCGLSLILVGTETAASQAQNSEHLARTRYAVQFSGSPQSALIQYLSVH
ncbi:hypothetical protein J6590_030704 [Homalodisca vitripennis]|nr:hypothetical protein J6590_030704 [Homalodisca vitripennis]